MMKIRTYLLTMIGFCWIIASCLQAQNTSKVKEEDLPQTARSELDETYRTYKINSLVKKKNGKEKRTYELELQKKKQGAHL